MRSSEVEMVEDAVVLVLETPRICVMAFNGDSPLAIFPVGDHLHRPRPANGR